MKKNVIASAALAVFALAISSCNAWKDNLPQAEELGIVQREFILKAEGESVDVEYLSNLSGTIRVNASWLHLNTATFSNDGIFGATADPNPGFPRFCQAILVTDNSERNDTVFFKQYGQKEKEFQLKSSSSILYNTTGITSTSVPVMTNMETGDFDIEILYSGAEKDWIREVTVSENSLVILSKDNTSKTSCNKAVIHFRYSDGWGEKKMVNLDIIQANADNALGVIITFSELRSMADQEDTGVISISDDIFLDGYVFSDVASGNVAENPNITSTKIDYTQSERSAYVESLDGKYGFWVLANTVQDNVLKPNSKVRLLLNGATIIKQSNPDRYRIEDFTSSMVISSEDADISSIPVKAKHIGELTDEDIYTKVQLLDCELPVRKGSMTPINELYSIAHYANGKTYDNITKSPLLLRDINGDSMYILTNTTCLYRRDGTPLNYGKGSITGVIVHELDRRFTDEDAEDEDECGYMGRYQIRHFSKSDFCFEEDFSNSFSGIICEWRYMVHGNADKSMPATYGEGYLTQTSKFFTYNALGTYVRPAEDYACLGPIGYAGSIFGENKGNPNGCGIVDSEGNQICKDDSYTNTGGDGKTKDDTNGPRIAWRCDCWYDAVNDRFYEWIVGFSTEGIQTERLSMQFAMVNQRPNDGNTPRFWKAEWSLTGDVSKASDWTLIGEFTCPDYLRNTNLPNQSGGFKPMDFPLPADLLCGKEKVYIRLVPTSTKAGTANSYSEGSLVNDPKASTARNALNYFAIRYNK